MIILQYKRLRSITGAYKATSAKVFEAEAGLMPLDTYLDPAMLMSRNVPGYAEVISCAKETVRKKFCNKRGRRRQPGATSMVVKDAWVRSTREKNARRIAGYNTAFGGTLAKKWARQKWNEPWDHYLKAISTVHGKPAHERELGRQRDTLHRGLRKAESSLAI